ncbi:Sodium/hydrogen exchanger [Fasciola gigantica]|uniref:Sodium/hydrogen exchanger n=1 Tax=Fasciola gigantica TaxID=46835 RepID=A0A504YT06_FASGI|nr:Sodium/hydrogen exchanger [Fasciola gigantica]
MTDSFIATSLLHLDNMFTNSVLIVITAFIVVCSVVKLCYRSGFRYLDYIPEPITVLLIGVIFGGVANYFDVELRYFDDETFFVIFLPPIIFEAILNVHKEYFIRHLSVILLFGFIGTLSNIFLVGTSLWLISQLSPSALGDLNPHPVAFYLFATLVSSVDSVIIIGILGEMQVHPSLYFIFIGESILNDGVTLIVFDYIYSFGCTVQSKMNLNLWALIALCVFVMTVKVLGSCFLGAICGSATAFLTKYTYKYTMIEPLIVLSAGYLTYLFDYGISWPGVSSLLVFGIIQTVYTFENVSGKSRITIKRLVHMTAAIAESLILLTIGYTLAVHEQVWNIRFIALSMALCIIWRFLVVYDVYGDKDQSIPNIQNQLEREKLNREMQTVNSTDIDAFDTETFVGPNVQQSSTERIAESSSTKTTISGYSPEKSPGCLECMQLILSSTVSVS